MQEIQTVDYIGQQLQKFNVTDSGIAELKERYMPLVINGLDDKKGYMAVREARLDVKARRVGIEKMRKELTADAVTLQRKVNEEAKRITVKLEEIEAHCQKQENIFEAEKQRIQIEKEKAEQQKYLERHKFMVAHGMTFDVMGYQGNYIESKVTYPTLTIKNMPESEWTNLCEQLVKLHSEKVAHEIAEYEAQKEEQKKSEEAERMARAAEAEAIRIEKDQLSKEKAEFEALKLASGIEKTYIDPPAQTEGNSIPIENMHTIDIDCITNNNYQPEKFSVEEYKMEKETINKFTIDQFKSYVAFIRENAPHIHEEAMLKVLALYA